MSYAYITDIETTGASWQTAQQDGPSEAGKSASFKMAQTDSGHMARYKAKIDNVGRRHGIDPALIAGIISRESRAGQALKNGWGDWSPQRNAYNAWGLMQVDVNPNGGGHTPRGAWDSEEHINQGAEILLYFIKRIRSKFPNWSREQQFRGGIAAYNTGDGNVHSYDGVDSCTTGGDYSSDVVARAQWYKRNGY